MKPAPSVELKFFGVGAPRQSVKVECESGVRPAGARQNVSQAEGAHYTTNRSESQALFTQKKGTFVPFLCLVL